MVALILFILIAALIAFVIQRLMGEPYGIVAFVVLIIAALLLAFGSSDTSHLHCC